MNKDGFFRVIIFLLQYYRIIFKLNPWVCSNILANLTFLDCSKRFADNFKLLKVKKKNKMVVFKKLKVNDSYLDGKSKRIGCFHFSYKK